MEKLVLTKKSLLHLGDEPFATLKSNHFKPYPQMPLKQIQHYLKIAARKKSQIIIQLKASSSSNHLTEVTGVIRLSPTSSQIILNPKHDKTVHLIQPQHINHLRLA